MKKVVLDKEELTVSLRDVLSDWTYIAVWDRGYSSSLPGLYKLHKSKCGQFSFCSLHNSDTHANGYFSSAREAIQETLQHETALVYEVKSIKDFIECLQNVQSKSHPVIVS